MLREHQVRHLLTTAEERLGQKLTLLRQHLRSRDPVPYIWEVIVIDALLRAGSVVHYEANTEAGLTPDLLVNTADSRQMWIEVAYVRDRFADEQKQLNTLLRRLTKEEERHGIPIGSIEWRADGDPSPAGYQQVLPAEQTLTRFFRLREIVAFFRAIKEAPDRRATCNLRRVGFTLEFMYVPRPGNGASGRSGGSLVSDVPKKIEEHSVFRALRAKGRKYSKLPDERPLVVCVGSEDSRPASSRQSPNAVQLRDAIFAAFREQPTISAAIVVAIESNNSPDHYGRVARTKLYENAASLRPLTPDDLALLERLDFNGVEYGGSWNEWEGRATIGERRKRLDGLLSYGKSALTRGGTMVELPVEVVLQMLSGVMTESEFRQKYKLDNLQGLGPTNPFRGAWEAGRPLLAITLIPADQRSRQQPMIRFDFGPPEAPILQVRRFESDGS